MSPAGGAPRRTRLGMITPSSNTLLEPVTASLVGAFPEVSVHFTRIRVTEISLAANSLAQAWIFRISPSMTRSNSSSIFSGAGATSGLALSPVPGPLS